MSDVPRNVEREIESAAGSLLDIKDIRLMEEQEEGNVYRIVVDDPDAEEGENPAVEVGRPHEDTMGIFGERLDKYFSQLRSRVLDLPNETEQELEQTRQELEESGHPRATGEDVEYGDGPVPNVDSIEGGYDDGQIRVESTSEFDVPEPDRDPTEGTVAEDTETDPPDRKPAIDGGENNMSEQSINTDDVWGRIADTALDGRDMEMKGHDIAAKALMEEIQSEIEEYMDNPEE